MEIFAKKKYQFIAEVMPIICLSPSNLPLISVKEEINLGSCASTYTNIRVYKKYGIKINVKKITYEKE